MSSSPTQRALDLAVATCGAVALAPVIAAAAIAVKVTSRGPVLFATKRVGRDGTLFTIYKFRSMVVGAHTAGPGITAGGDRRITPVGRWLRRTKIDELPQLINVLRGDMSIVGPRPEDPRYVALYTDAQREILRWRPGITGNASVHYRDEESVLSAAADVEAAYAQIMDHKIQLDLAYQRHRSVIGDIKMMIATVVAIVKPPGGDSTTRSSRNPG